METSIVLRQTKAILRARVQEARARPLRTALLLLVAPVCAVVLGVCCASFRLEVAYVPHGARSPGVRTPLPRFAATTTLAQCARKGAACTLAAAPATARTRTLAGAVVDALTGPDAERAPPLALHADSRALAAAFVANATEHFAGLDFDFGEGQSGDSVRVYMRTGVLPTLPEDAHSVTTLPRNASAAIDSGLGTLCDALQRVMLPPTPTSASETVKTTILGIRALPAWRANAAARGWALETVLCAVPAIWAVAQHVAGHAVAARVSGRAARLVELGARRGALVLARHVEALALAVYTGVLVALGGALCGGMRAAEALALAFVAAPLAGAGAALLAGLLARLSSPPGAVRTVLAVATWTAAVPVALVALVSPAAPAALHAVLAVVCAPYGFVALLLAACTRAFAGFSPLGTGTLVLCMLVSDVVHVLVSLAAVSCRPQWSRWFKWWSRFRSGGQSISKEELKEDEEEEVELLGTTTTASDDEQEEQVEEEQAEEEETKEGEETVGIKTTNLSKVYHEKGQEPVVALRGVSAVFQRGEITGLLGENGAGKSTLLGVLSGATQATSGSASVHGAVGVCPQNDVLWDDLTAPQHVQLVAGLRGIDNQEQQELLDECSLPVAEHRGAPVRTFSAGMQRKLSVALALVGAPAAVLLDEPTSGVDVVARRALWAALRSLRAHGRTLVLATHAMDEAAALCDRVYILHAGRVRAHGTPDALSRRFGAGCTLSFDLEEDARVEEIQNSLGEALSQLFGQCTPADAAPGTLAFCVPATARNKFPQALAALEGAQFQQQHNIRSFALSTCALQDAFEHFCASDDNESNAEEEEDEIASGVLEADEGVPLGSAKESTGKLRTWWQQWWMQFAALTRVRFLQYRRDLSYALGMTLVVALEFLLVLGVLAAVRAELNSNAGRITVHNISSLGKSYPAPVLPYYFVSSSNSSEKAEQQARRIIDAVADTFNPKPAVKQLKDAQSLDAFVAATTAASGGTRYPFAFGFEVTDSDTLGVELMYNESFPLSLPVAVNTFHGAARNVLLNVSSHVGVALHAVGEPGYIAPTNALDPVRLASFLAVALVLFLASTRPLAALWRERTTGFAQQLALAGLRPTADVLSATLTGGTALLAAGAVLVVLVAACGVHPIAASSLVPLALGTALYALAQGAHTAHVAALFRRTRSTACVELVFVVGTLAVTYVCYVATRTVVYLLATADGLAPSTDRFWRFAVLPAELLCPTFAYLNLLINLLLYPAGTPLRVFFGWKSYAAVDVLSLALSIPLIIALAVARRYKEDYIERDGPDVVALLPSEGERQGVDDSTSVATARAAATRATIAFEHVSKIYMTRKKESHIAVDGLDLHIGRGERFGLLGPNGSGKTTTVGLLTAQVPLTAGAVLLDGTAQGASRQTFYARARFGHCPQRGGLLAHLTCREHLTLLAAIRASRPGTRDNRDSSSSNSSSASSGDFFRDVAGLERAFGLAVRAGQRAGTLSGGTRRRLCAAMALLDGTRVAVLDEPSTGMDVRARRALWARVRAQCNGGSSSSKGGAVVLTTHAVEEAERVCTRLGVLVRGRLAHVGTVQQLRAALGAGCVVTVVVGADCPADRRDHCALLQAAAPEVRALPVVRPNACTLAYCTGPVASIAALFRTLESAVNDPSNHIVDYTVTQATLETALAHLFDSSDVDSP